MKPEVFEIRREALAGRIKTAWDAVHHNASIHHHYPDFRNEYESELFWDWLDSEANLAAREAEEGLKKFEIYCKVYSCGRQGATFYPEQFCRSNNGASLGSFRWDVFHLSYDSEKEELEHLARVAKALEWFNKFWNKKASEAQSQWRIYKRREKLNPLIRSYDGKTKKLVPVWS